MFGAGYVGLVTGACFADLGHEVVIRDVLPERIEQLEAGEVPIYEPGLDLVLERNRGRLRFTLDRSEEHTSELQPPYVISYAVFCLKKKQAKQLLLHPMCQVFRSVCAGSGRERAEPERSVSASSSSCRESFFFLINQRHPASALFPSRALCE